MLNNVKRIGTRLFNPVFGWMILALLCLMAALTMSPAWGQAQDERVSKFYEDALIRFKTGELSAAELQLKNALQINPRYLPGQLLLGKVLLQSGKATEAEQAFKLALRLGVDRSEIAPMLAQAYFEQAKFAAIVDTIDPNGLRPTATVELLIVHAYAHTELGQLEAASRALNEARKIRANHPGIPLAQASIALRQGQFSEAKQLASQVIAAAPREAKGWHLRGTAHHAMGEANNALDDYKQAITLDPKLGETRIARAGLLIDQGQYDAALLDLSHFHGLVAKDPRVNYLRAMAYAKQGKRDPSRESLLEAARSIEAIPVDFLARRPQFLLIGGMTYAGLNHKEKAQLYLQRFLLIEPKHIGVKKLLAAILIADRNYVKALSVLEPSLKTHADDAHYLALLATAHNGVNQTRTATRLLEQALSVSQQSPDMRASLGYTLLGSGELESGLDHLRQAFAADPSNHQVGLTLAVMELKRGKQKSALDIAGKLVAQNPSNALIHNLQGAIRAHMGDMKGARISYEKALTLDPRADPPQLNLARLDRAEGNPEAARKRLLQILQTHPKQAQALFELAAIESASGQPQEAIRHLEKIRALAPNDMEAAATLLDLYVSRKLWDRVIALTKDLETQAGSHFNALSSLGRAYNALGEKAKAISTFDRMVPLAGNDPAQLSIIARQHAWIGNIAGAQQMLTKALSQHPNFLAAEIFLTELDLRQGQIDKSEQRLVALRTQWPQEPAVLKLQGDIALARQNFTEAIAAYRATLAKQSNPDVLFSLSNVYQQSGQHARAIELLSQEAKRRPNNNMLLRALAEAHLRAGQLAQARSGYEQLLKKDERDVGTLNNLAYILIREKNPTALHYAERAYRLAPEDAAINDTLGWALLANGKADKALHYLREARLRDPGNGEIRYHLAVALNHLGKRQEAREELEASLSGSPFEDEAQARALLNQLR